MAFLRIVFTMKHLSSIMFDMSGMSGMSDMFDGLNIFNENEGDRE